MVDDLELEGDPLAYASPREYLDVLKLEQAIFSEERIAGLRKSLLASSRWIDRQCEGQFALDPEPVERHFTLRTNTPDCRSRILKLPPFAVKQFFRPQSGSLFKDEGGNEATLVIEHPPESNTFGLVLYKGVVDGKWEDVDAAGRVVRAGEYTRQDGSTVAPPAEKNELLEGDFLQVEGDSVFEHPFTIKISRSYDLEGGLAILPDKFIFAPVKNPRMVEPEPFTQVVLTDKGKSWRNLVSYEPFVISVSATWGWPVVPEPIKKACIHYASLERIEGARGVGEDTPYGSSLDVSNAAMWIVRSYLSSYKTHRRQPPFVWKQALEEVAVEFDVYGAGT